MVDNMPMDDMGTNTVTTTVTTVNKVYTLNFIDEDIAKVDLYSSGDYNYASVGVRKESTYVNISYEWSGDNTPDFIMDVVSSFICKMDCQDGQCGEGMTMASVASDDDFKAFLVRLEEASK
ncbi:hypothetical protein JZU46_00215 [bacterium]|nr:hypothetical protein [bacterium]